MHKGRLEAFTDGVIAIIITIMVLEIKVPHGDQWQDILPLWPKLLSYVLSFLYVGIYWNNHHHTLQATKSVNGGILWSNLHLLFWLSLLPFSTGWVGENHFTQQPMILYGLNLLMCGVAYFIFSVSLVRHHGKDSELGKAFGSDIKGKISLGLYLVGLLLAWVNPWLAFITYAVVAVIWLIPDRRMHQAIS
jgi:uncharacterized membrane protein